MTESEKIKLVRLKLGLNQIEFGEILGLQQGSYSKVEKGHSNVTRQTKLLIKCLYGLSLEYWEAEEDADSFLQKIKKSYIRNDTGFEVENSGVNDDLEQKLLALKVKRLEMEKQSLEEQVKIYEFAIDKNKEKKKADEKPRKKA